MNYATVVIQIALMREILILYLLAQSIAIVSAFVLAPAPAPDSVAAIPGLQAPSSVYLDTSTPASPGSCSFDTYRSFLLSGRTEVSATLQGKADNALVQIFSMADRTDGPFLASFNGAEALNLVNTLRMDCEMQCVADGGRGSLGSPNVGFYSNDYSTKFEVQFHGRVSGFTLKCIKEKTALLKV